MRLTRSQITFDGFILATLLGLGVASISRALMGTDTGPIWGLMFAGILCIGLASVPMWHVRSVRAMHDPPTPKERARNVGQALTIGICLFVLVIGVLLLALGVNVTRGGSEWLDAIIVTVVLLEVPAVFVFLRMRRKIRVALPSL